VLHAHCIHMLSHAVQADPVAAIGAKLDGFDWGLVPYVKPGANLAAKVRGLVETGRNVIVLANHGVIVAAETVGAAEDLLARVVSALRVVPVPLRAADLGAVPDGWVAGPPALSHIALDPKRLAMATGGSLYPDHVIFCGVGALAAEAPPEGDGPPMVLIPGKGALLRADASAGTWALSQCLGDVLMRVPDDAKLHYLTLEQNGELLNWDAEKYRLALNA
ncbi:MAG: class II aldolase/adducin family protein, partial [Albidovulum sp.]